MQKTTEELDALKKNWINDPSWDIEETEGFEEHEEELLAFRKEQELEWQRKEEERIARRARIVTVETGITDSSIAQAISTFSEIDNEIDRAIRQNENIDFIAVAQARATLLLAAQLARIADAFESLEETDSLSQSVRIWGSDK